VNDLSFSLDGKRLATGSSDGKLRIWEVASGTCLQEWEPHDGAPVYSAIFCAALASDNENLILSGSLRNGQLRLWSSESKALLQVRSSLFVTTFAIPQSFARLLHLCGQVITSRMRLPLEESTFPSMLVESFYLWHTLPCPTFSSYTFVYQPQQPERPSSTICVSLR